MCLTLYDWVLKKKGYRGKPLTDKQKAKNTVKSKPEQE
jgi:hypothetical protein